MSEPRTTAGRALLAGIVRGGPLYEDAVAQSILAIEAEARAESGSVGLNVERLARALHADSSTCLFTEYRLRGPDHRAHQGQAGVIAARYAALAREEATE